MTDFDVLLCLCIQGPLSSVLSINKMQCYPEVLFKAVILLEKIIYNYIIYIMCCCPKLNPTQIISNPTIRNRGLKKHSGTVKKKNTSYVKFQSFTIIRL